MKWRAMSLALVLAACGGRRFADVPIVVDVSPARPCQGGNLGTIWTDSLPQVADTSLQHLVAGGSSLEPAADLDRPRHAGLVRARFAIDTAGRVIPGSGIIEAFSDEVFARAVCNALPRLTYEPVVLDGRKTVAGLVHVPFTFSAR